MAIYDNKNAFLNEISAMQSLSEASPKIKTTNILQSLSTKNKAIQFIQDIIMILEGAYELKNIIVNTLTTELPKIEYTIKNALKTSLKSNVNCSYDPLLPPILQNSGQGIDIKVKSTDFFGLFHINPTTNLGKLLYTDTNSALSTTDLSVFLYYTLQNPTTVEHWGIYSPVGQDIANITFNPTSVYVNNVFNIKASTYYSNKSLTDFNNSFIDSVSLFPKAQTFNNIIDNIFGSISFQAKLPSEWIKLQEETNTVLMKFYDTDDTNIIDDSYFTFNNEDLFNIQNNSTNRSQGIKEFITCGSVKSSIDYSAVTAISQSIEVSTSVQQTYDAISNGIDLMSNLLSSSGGASSTDNFSLKVSFLSEIFKAIYLTIMNTILGPKLLLLLQVNHKIIYNNNSDPFDTPIDFIKSHKQLFNELKNIVVNILISILLKEAIKQVKALVLKNKALDDAEKLTLYQNQLLSLTGINPNNVNIIRQLGLG